jgi:hypothetical protein
MAQYIAAQGNRLKIIGFFALFLAQNAYAGVFDLTHFVNPGSFAIGLEPVATLSDGGGVGFNFKYTQGINELTNAQFIIGTGTGIDRFRVGGNLDVDLFPDIDNQPGIGVAFQGLYYNLPSDGRFDLTAIPYIHKAFTLQGGDEVDPFLAFPVGLAFQDGMYHFTDTLAFGSLFKKNEHLSYVLEMGISMNHSETYISGGFVYYP